jgi:NAD(P)-dependent dehydrogenase (short-subunit alcohol dehydrogenase family)
VVAAIEAHGGRAVFLREDLLDANATQRCVEQSLEAFGALDRAFNNADITPPTTRLHDLPLED